MRGQPACTKHSTSAWYPCQHAHNSGVSSSYAPIWTKWESREYACTACVECAGGAMCRCMCVCVVHMYVQYMGGQLVYPHIHNLQQTYLFPSMHTPTPTHMHYYLPMHTPNPHTCTYPSLCTLLHPPSPLTLSRTLRFAPALHSSIITSGCPYRDATCAAVSPTCIAMVTKQPSLLTPPQTLFWWFTLAPCSLRYWTTSEYPYLVAQ